MFDIEFCKNQIQKDIQKLPFFDQMILYASTGTISPGSTCLKKLKDLAYESNLKLDNMNGGEILWRKRL